MAQPRIYVQAPTATPLPFGIFSVATIPPNTDPHFSAGGVQYEADDCGVAGETGPACAIDPADLDATDGINVVTGDPFVVYKLFTCRAPGGFDRGAERARTALQTGEQRAVEAALSRILPATEGAVDLSPSPGNPVHPVDGIALLEAYAATNYGGTPTLHIPRRVGTVVTTHGTVVRAGTQLQTVQGALVASGGGYALTGPLADPEDPDSGPVAADGTAWLYVTGPVVLHRSEVIEVAPTLALSPATNQFAALAERPYVATTDCVVAAVLVSTLFFNTVSVAG